MVLLDEQKLYNRTVGQDFLDSYVPIETFSYMVDQISCAAPAFLKPGRIRSSTTR